jgi:hypothetical protein
MVVVVLLVLLLLVLVLVLVPEENEDQSESATWSRVIRGIKQSVKFMFIITGIGAAGSFKTFALPILPKTVPICPPRFLMETRSRSKIRIRITPLT